MGRHHRRAPSPCQRSKSSSPKQHIDVFGRCAKWLAMRARRSVTAACRRRPVARKAKCSTYKNAQLTYGCGTPVTLTAPRHRISTPATRPPPTARRSLPRRRLAVFVRCQQRRLAVAPPTQSTNGEGKHRMARLGGRAAPTPLPTVRAGGPHQTILILSDPPGGRRGSAHDVRRRRAAHEPRLHGVYA